MLCRLEHLHSSALYRGTLPPIAYPDTKSAYLIIQMVPSSLHMPPSNPLSTSVTSPFILPSSRQFHHLDHHHSTQFSSTLSSIRCCCHQFEFAAMSGCQSTNSKTSKLQIRSPKASTTAPGQASSATKRIVQFVIYEQKIENNNNTLKQYEQFLDELISNQLTKLKTNPNNLNQIAKHSITPPHQT